MVLASMRMSLGQRSPESDDHGGKGQQFEAWEGEQRPGSKRSQWSAQAQAIVRNFPCQTLKISKVSLVVMGS
jgi:hypothetical protein